MCEAVYAAKQQLRLNQFERIRLLQAAAAAAAAATAVATADVCACTQRQLPRSRQLERKHIASNNLERQQQQQEQLIMPQQGPPDQPGGQETSRVPAAACGQHKPSTPSRGLQSKAQEVLKAYDVQLSSAACSKAVALVALKRYCRALHDK